MRRRRSIDVHICLTQKLLDELDDDVEMDRFPNRSHAIIYYLKLGMKFVKIKDRCEDPAVREIIDDRWDSFKIEESVNNMTADEIEYIKKMLHMIQDEKINKMIL